MTKITKYLPGNIEQKWQDRWSKENLYSTDLSKPKKYYCLAEFAYPSGDLHIGHVFTWVGADVFARFKRMQGYSVFFPNGFDAFGLPAENAAIKRGIHPKDWTYSNIESMKAQFSKIGGSFTFDHQVITSDPDYYRWNQWLFLKMYEKNLAYKGKALSNWCPNCQTVLANEGVEAGKCWRCGSDVVQKEIAQWFFKITDYADRLIWNNNRATDKISSPTNELTNIHWPQSVQEGQNSWIGRSEGMIIKFEIKNLKLKIKNSIEVFTVYPETIFGVTYLVLAPEHELVKSLTTPDQKLQVEEYIKIATSKSEEDRKIAAKDKTGVFTGSYIVNPVNGQEVPIWVADYVLAGYGTGAVMGVPGSDHRDFEFAQKYNLPIVRVIGETTSDTGSITSSDQVLEEGVLVNSEQFTGSKTPDPARESVKDWLVEKSWGVRKVQYHLHDWSISRQRYWGTPVPIINCEDCGVVPVSYEDLPIELPYEVDFTPKGKPPLATAEDWVKVACPECGGDARRETETMDTFVDSSWYFFRYLDPTYQLGPFPTDLAAKIMPVDIYFGGAEHTLGHTLYARFLTKVIKDLGLIDFEEFALRRINHGIILGPDGEKMSKSKGNVISPDAQIKEYGADTIRVYLSFFMPYEGVGPWIPDRVQGSYRFLQRVWGLFDKLQTSDYRLPTKKEDLKQMHSAIQRVTTQIESIKFNTAVAALMEWLNYLSRKPAGVALEEYQTLLKLLAPFAPHLSEELWYQLGHKTSIHLENWPAINIKHLEEDILTIVVQVNGKVRDNIQVPNNSKEEDIKKLALESDKIQKFVTGPIKKTIYIPGKILSIVV